MEESPGRPLSEQKNSSRLGSGAKIGIGIGGVVVVVVLVLVLIFLLNNPETTETVRDLFIIVLALESLVIGTLLVILVYQLITLVRMLRDEIKPIIESTQQTLNTTKGTATFVSQRVTRPAIVVSSYASGIARSVSVLVQMLPRKRHPQPTPASDSTPSSPADERAASEPL
jgi:hypothetical protein